MAKQSLTVNEVAAEVIALAESGEIIVQTTERGSRTIVTLHNKHRGGAVSQLGQFLLAKFFGPQRSAAMCQLKASAFGPWLEQLNRSADPRPALHRPINGNLATVMLSGGNVRQWTNKQSSDIAWLEATESSAPRSVSMMMTVQAIRNAFSPYSSTSDRMTE